jgi:hypothetical protein
MTQLEGDIASACQAGGRERPTGCLTLTSSPHTTPDYPPKKVPMASPPPPVEDQARLLEDALAVVRQQTMLMRRCLETPGKLMDALKCRYVLHYLAVQMVMRF